MLLELFVPGKHEKLLVMLQLTHISVYFSNNLLSLPMQEHLCQLCVLICYLHNILHMNYDGCIGFFTCKRMRYLIGLGNDYTELQYDR